MNVDRITEQLQKKNKEQEKKIKYLSFQLQELQNEKEKIEKEKNTIQTKNEESFFEEDSVYIGVSTNLNGEIKAESLIIKGKVNGTIEARNIIVEKKAELLGKVTAEQITIKGDCEADIESNVVRVIDGGYYKGECNTAKMIVDENSTFDGNNNKVENAGIKPKREKKAFGR